MRSEFGCAFELERRMRFLLQKIYLFMRDFKRLNSLITVSCVKTEREIGGVVHFLLRVVGGKRGRGGFKFQLSSTFHIRDHSFMFTTLTIPLLPLRRQKESEIRASRIQTRRVAAVVN